VRWEFVETNDPEIKLKPLAEEDAYDLYSIIEENYFDLREFLPVMLDFTTIEKFKKWIEDKLFEQQFGLSLWYSIIYKDDFCGMICFYEINPNDKFAKLGYWLIPGVEGNGVATIASKKGIDILFDKLKLHKVLIDAATENTKSIAVAKRLGFTHEGTLREQQFLNNRYYDIEVFGLINEK
jgi:ribosomal-protein-serine acetyltransferase